MKRYEMITPTQLPVDPRRCIIEVWNPRWRAPLQCPRRIAGNDEMCEIHGEIAAKDAEIAELQAAAERNRQPARCDRCGWEDR